MFSYVHYVVRESPVLWKHAAQVSQVSELGLMFWPDVSASAGTVPEIRCAPLHVKPLLALIESCCFLQYVIAEVISFFKSGIICTITNHNPMHILLYVYI